MMSDEEMIARLEQLVPRVDPRLVLDRGNLRAVVDPYPGLEYGLQLGEAAALLFMPAADLAAADWETRVFKKLEAARRYLESFAHRPPAASPPPEARRPLERRG
jgi:hypothetical protein